MIVPDRRRVSKRIDEMTMAINGQRIIIRPVKGVGSKVRTLPDTLVSKKGGVTGDLEELTGGNLKVPLSSVPHL